MKLLLSFVGILLVLGILYTQTSLFDEKTSGQEQLTNIKQEHEQDHTTVTNAEDPPSPAVVEAEEVLSMQRSLANDSNSSIPPDVLEQKRAKLIDQRREELNKLMLELEGDPTDPANRAKIKAKADELLAKYNKEVVPVALAKIQKKLGKVDKEMTPEENNE